MKKKCTPQNNAIKINTPVYCPEPIIPIVNGCVDPFTYTWNTAINQATLDETLSVQDWFSSLLSNGQVLSDASNVCCPSCNATPVYFLGNVEGVVAISSLLSWKKNPDLLCCVNIAANATSYSAYSQNWFIQPPCCNNDFESCLNQFSTIVDMILLLETGVVEVNGYDNTLICKIYNLLINTPEDLFQGATLSEVFIGIIEQGFVSYCCDCNVFIGTYGSFLKWWTATKGCGTLEKALN
jgi:hypothetical protein